MILREWSKFLLKISNWTPKSSTQCFVLYPWLAMKDQNVSCMSLVARILAHSAICYVLEPSDYQLSLKIFCWDLLGSSWQYFLLLPKLSQYMAHRQHSVLSLSCNTIPNIKHRGGNMLSDRFSSEETARLIHIERSNGPINSDILSKKPQPIM